MQMEPLSTWKLFLRHWGWAAAFPMIFAIVFGLIAMFEGRNAERLEADGVNGIAVITDKDIEIDYDSDGDRTTTYRLYFTVETPDGDVVDNDTVGKGFYNSVSIGARTPIRYWRLGPDVNEIEPGSTTTTIWITKVISAVALTITLAWGYIAWEKSAKAVRIRERGARRRAKVTGLVNTSVTVNGRRLYRLGWVDDEGVPGKSMMHKPAKLDAFPEGSEIWIYADPAGRKKSWWEGDIGPRRENVGAVRR